MCDAFPIASPSTCSTRLLWALSLTRGLSVVLWDWPHRSCMILLWKELPSPLLGTSVVGSRTWAHYNDRFLPAYWDVWPGAWDESRNGTISGLPFQHFWLQKRQFMLYIFLSSFQFNNPLSNVFFLCPFLSCPPQILVLHVHRFLQPPREQSRDQTGLAILKLSIPNGECWPE